MSSQKTIVTSIVFTLWVFCAQQVATAGDKGTFDFVQSISITNQMAIEQVDHKMIGIVARYRKDMLSEQTLFSEILTLLFSRSDLV